MTLPEARDHAVAAPGNPFKFVQELAWREYWRHVLDRRGRGVYADVEAPKHHHGRAAGLPDALVRAETGLACVDEPLSELVATEYMHNHARMWFASATTHLLAPGAADVRDSALGRFSRWWKKAQREALGPDPSALAARLKDEAQLPQAGDGDQPALAPPGGVVAEGHQEARDGEQQQSEAQDAQPVGAV